MPRTTADTKVIYRLDPTNPMDDSEVLVLGGAGRYSMAGLRRKAAREGNDVATELAQPRPNYDAIAHMLAQLTNTVNTMQAAMAELEEIRRKGGVRSRGIGMEEDQHADPVQRLQDRLETMVADGADTGYDAIDGEMWKISSAAGISPHDLHDEYVARFKQTPDDHAAELKRKLGRDVMFAEAVALHEQQRSQGTPAKLAWLEVTRAMLARGHTRSAVYEAVDAAMLAGIKP